MKALLALLAVFSCTLSAEAKCAGSGLSAFPIKPELRKNSILILDGYAESQKVILDLNKKYPVYLKSGSKKVKLLVKEICVGQFRVTQALLQPETVLEAGLTYTLCVDHLPEGEALIRYNEKTSKAEAITYKVMQGNDTEAPLILLQPREMKKHVVQYGCGPAISVIFDYGMTDSSEVIVKATVKNIKAGTEISYYVSQKDNLVEIGHGMCSGAFRLEDGDTYEAEFAFMDASGNLTAWTGERLKFTNPVKQPKQPNK